MARIVKFEEALADMQNGRPVAVPTETVYGLAGRIDHPDCIETIFALKNRPFFDPLIIHVNSIEMAKCYVTSWLPIHDKLAHAFWPGPLTLVLPKNEKVDERITSGLPDVAIRWPSSPAFERLIKSIGYPLAAPSANQFGRISPTEAQHVLSEFPHDDLAVLDGGRCRFGIESSVIKVSDDDILILRPGAITQEQIQDLFPNLKILQFQDKSSPGQLDNHYQPRKRLKLIVARAKTETELSKIRKENNGLIELKLEENPQLCARSLYAKLRQCDASEASEIFCIWKFNENSGLWQAIYNRLQRASSEIIR